MRGSLVHCSFFVAPMFKIFFLCVPFEFYCVQ